MAEVKSHKVKQLSSRLDPNAIYWVQASANLPIEGFITDIQGVPYPLKDISGSGGITGLTNTDGNLVITGADNKVINLAPALLSIINSALQSGDNVSELTNDAGYITSADLPTKTSELINDGSDETSTYVETDELGATAFSNDYNDLDNLPTFLPVIRNHSWLLLDDGTNPHGTTKGDVGLGNVDNTSDLNKPISTATQTALNLKENVANKTTNLTSPDDTKYPTTLAVVNENKKATITVELINQLTTDFYAPNALRINSTALISGSGTITLKVNDVAYTLGNLITQGQKITVETTTASVYNLISIYE